MEMLAQDAQHRVVLGRQQIEQAAECAHALVCVVYLDSRTKVWKHVRTQVLRQGAQVHLQYTRDGV